MSYYQKKYTLEFDDIIKEEFNNYKLEIFKKYPTTTADNVYETVTASENISIGDPVVYVASGVVVRAKASTSSLMPHIGIANTGINQGGSGQILISGVFENPTSVNETYYVGENGGYTTSTVGLTTIDVIGYQFAYNVLVLTDREVTLKGDGSPIKLNYNLVQDDILSPLRSSYLDISFYKESLSDDFSELFISENDSFKVYLYKNSNLFWQGWIGTQLTSEPFASPPYVIKMRAYDGLHLLKDIPYFDSLDVFQATSNLFNDRYGYHNLTDVLEKCIYNTGVLNDVYYYVKITNDETTNLSTTFVNDTRVHHQTFLNGESNSMNMQEVLQNILESLGATIYQRDGNWCVVRISDFTLNTGYSSAVVLKRSTWRADDDPSATNYVLTTQSSDLARQYISSEVDFFQIEANTRMTLQYPLKEVIIKQDFDHNMVTDTTIDSVKDLGASDPSGVYLFTEWEPSGASEAVVLRSNDSQSQAKNLNKSFIEVDLGTSDMDINFNDEALYYPVTHDCTIDSSTISGLRAEAKIRPLGRSQVGDEAAAVVFSPRLSWQGGAKGFGIGGATRRFVLKSYAPTTLPPQANIVRDYELSIGTANYAPELTRSNLTIRAANNSDYVVTISTTAYPTWYVSGTLNGTNTITKADFTNTPLGKMTPAEYTVSITTASASIESIEWDIEGIIDGSSIPPGTDSWEVKWTGIPAVDNKDTTDVAATIFKKDFNESQADYAAARIVTNKINDWFDCSITGSDGWNSAISSLKVEMYIFGGAKFLDASGVFFPFPYTNTYDVSYSNIKLVPLVTDSKFVPKKQEYIISQNNKYSTIKTKSVQMGSGLFNTGSNVFVGFQPSTPPSAVKSWTNWDDTKLSGFTMQHLLAACYMQLYRISVRRMDGTHYGNYKYGDRLVLKVNGSTETLNGSQGKFFPMRVVMDLKMAKVSFSGDDLLDNTGSSWISGLTRKIKWIGDNNITQTETLT